MKAKKVIRFLLVVAVLLSMAVPVAAASPEEFTDIPDNWSKTAIIEAISNGLLNGSNGKIMPDTSLRRCEMAAIINRAFGATQKGDISKFIDIQSGKWYVDDIAKAVKMGTFSGSGNQMRPEDFITRQEAFAVLARAFKIKTGNYSVLDKFNDKDKISEWAKPEVAAVVAAGYVKGSDGSLNPTEKITRAEFAQVMYNMVKTYIKEAGTYTAVNDGNVMINVPGVTLKGVTVKGDLIIGDGVDGGNIILDNVKVEGRVVVRGGGKNSVHVINGSEIDGVVIIDNVNNEVRIVTDSGTTVKKIEAGSKTILEGNFGEVRVIGSTSGSSGGSLDVEIKGNVRDLSVDSDARITLTSGTISNVTVGEQGTGSEIIVSGAEVSQLEALSRAKVVVNSGTVDKVTVGKAAQDTTLEVAEGAEVGKVTANAKAVISGNGTVTDVEANADDIKVDTKGTKLTVKKGVKGVTAGGKEVEGGTTITTGETEEEESGSIFFPGGGFPGGDFPGGGNSTPGGSNDEPGGNDDTPGGNDDEPEDKEITISGTVSLPVGDLAPAGGIKLKVYAIDNDWSPDNSNEDGFFYIDLTIPQGKSSAGYSLPIPVKTGRKNFIVWYSIESSSKYVQRGYYSTGGTVLNQITASLVEVTGKNVGGIDFRLIPGNVISGKVSLPDGDAAPAGGIQVYISAETDNGTPNVFEDDYYFGKYVTIPEGKNSADYSITVMPNAAESYYIVGYSQYSVDSYLGKGYYGINGMTYYENLAGPVDVSSGDAEGIDLELMPARIISGTISLPDGDTAPAGGVKVYIITENDSGSSVYGSSVTIPEGKNSAKYSIPVSVDKESAEYIVQYSFSNEDYGYGKFGYYSREGTRASYSSADYIDVSSGDVEGINLEILTANTISGIILLPESYLTLDGSVKINIDAINYEDAFLYGRFIDSIFTTVNMTEGQNTAEYSLAVPVDSVSKSEYIIRYSIYSEQSYLEFGYYSIDGIAQYPNLATPVDVSNGDAEGINFDLAARNVISGIVSLPGDDVAPAGGIEVRIYAENDNGTPGYYDDDFSFNTAVTIPEGQSSAEYSIRIPVPTDTAITEYKIRYVVDVDSGYVECGYYNPEGTTFNIYLATPLDVSTGDKEGIDLELIPANFISGTISLPNGETAPEGGFYGFITAKYENETPDCEDDYNFSYYFYIPEGENSVDYILPVVANPVGTGYIVSYIVPFAGYRTVGYYSEDGTVPYQESTDPVDVSSRNAEGIDLEIIPFQ